MNRIISTFLRGAPLALAAGLFATACVQEPPSGNLSRPDPVIDDPTTDFENQPGVFAGDEDNTHSHMGDLGEGVFKDPFEVLAQRQEEGPPEVRTRLHSCQKLQNNALQNVLTSLGVNIDATAQVPTAGQLFKGGGGALGAASYDARVGEAVVWSAAGAAKLFDIFVQAAPEIIANLPNVDQCKVDGVGVEMFDANNQCNRDAIACITGRPATDSHVAICNKVVTSASDVEKGKRIAVGTMMAAAHSCE
ncbi:hypothetical protein [Polyangium sp. 15x6]|uniref:hypothetical protein n=1 Tax=Polyangium sp. 15x6 TaxID=3042687 RepID=UPI00249AB162|nr:hypothetical protein [Polyangium sp. 15x6]MDI3283696.1 hypothetical protein [Polyangium sp. 15x6]